ncbi:MAG TPA: GNAT family N-acetyltransferase [Myxococcales bacterium]|nr:GNAT family N-acetyltransferase [Myxococcales bacterium]
MRFLQTDRLLLRRFGEGDAERLIALDADPEVMRFINGGAPTAAEAIRIDILPRFLRYHAAYDHFGFFAAETQGEFIGWFHFRPGRDASLGTELGYRLARAAWGRGYAVEGGRALLQHGFAHGVRRAIARTLVANVRSQRVLEKLGFALQGEVVEEQFPGSDRRALLYSIDRPDPPSPAPNQA